MTAPAESIYIRFNDGKDGGNTEWTVKLFEAGKEGYGSVLGPVKISPGAVQQVADLLSRLLQSPIPTNAVREQNVNAHAMVSKAVKAAEDAATRLRKRADNLSEWTKAMQ